MKASKKQVKSKANKPQVNDNNLAPTIQTFFKSAPKSFVVEKNVAKPNADDDGAKKYYVDVLKEKLKHRVLNEGCEAENATEMRSRAVGVLENGHCNRDVPTEIHVPCEVQITKNSVECAGCAQKDIEISDWEQKYKLEVEQRKELKKVYVNLTVRFSELHSKYTDVLKAADVATATRASHAANDAVNTISDEDILTENEIKYLECMSLEKKSDCTFILQALKYAYRSDLSALSTRTLKGTAKWTEFADNGEEVKHPEKNPLTPRKVERIKGLFVQRISKCEIHAAEFTQRMQEPYVNKLFAAGIKNISKKFK